MSVVGGPRHRSRAGEQRTTGLDLALAAGLVVVGAVIGWLRLSPQARDVVWAEDGWIFLADRLEHPDRFHLFDPYAGYLHVVPRTVVALAAEAAPPPDYALTLTALCCLVTSLVAATVYLCSASVLQSRAARLVLGGTTVLAPAAEYEVLGNAANLHSYFMWLMPWLLLARVNRWWTSALLGVLALLAALTEIQVALFLPLAFLALAWPKRWPAVAGLAVGVVAQVVTTVVSPRSSNPLDPPSVGSVLRGVLLDPLLSMVTGRAQDRVVLDIGWWVPGLMLLVLVGTVACVLRYGGAARGLTAVTALVATFVPYVASLALNPDPQTAYATYTPAQWAAYATPRYSVAASMFGTAVVVIGLDLLLAAARRAGARHARVAARVHRSRPWVVVALGALAAVTVVQLLNAPPTGSRRDRIDRWSTQVSGLIPNCQRLGPDQPVAIAQAPEFGVIVTDCRALLRWSGDQFDNSP